MSTADEFLALLGATDPLKSENIRAHLEQFAADAAVGTGGSSEPAAATATPRRSVLGTPKSASDVRKATPPSRKGPERRTDPFAFTEDEIAPQSLSYKVASRTPATAESASTPADTAASPHAKKPVAEGDDADPMVVDGDIFMASQEDNVVNQSLKDVVMRLGAAEGNDKIPALGSSHDISDALTEGLAGGRSKGGTAGSADASDGARTHAQPRQSGPSEMPQERRRRGRPKKQQSVEGGASKRQQGDETCETTEAFLDELVEDDRDLKQAYELLRLTRLD